ncbi:unnamed protein product [Brachionus calyciflorus]|uniref:Uncharacterized protein n=1 Tax=Brachionus calyciflorus TaxID=104777 RepID=A0A813QQH7_9BILA|nr:unnamed protein product [Brachionus calyciflorus]
MEKVEDKILQQLKSSKEDIKSIPSTINENASDLGSIKDFVRDSSAMIIQIGPQIKNARENIKNVKNSLNN